MELKFNFWLGHTKKMIGPIHLSKVGKIILEFTDDIVSLQYTGLKDNNGKDIFNGHILEDRFGAISQIVYVDDLAGFRDLSKIGYTLINQVQINNDNIKIIGNIYENPELINV